MGWGGRLDGDDRAICMVLRVSEDEEAKERTIVKLSKVFLVRCWKERTTDARMSQRKGWDISDPRMKVSK